MNDFITAHGDQIFNDVFITLMGVIVGAGIYAWRKIGRDYKAFVNNIKNERQEGYLGVSSDGRVIFIRTNGKK